MPYRQRPRRRSAELQLCANTRAPPRRAGALRSGRSRLHRATSKLNQRMDPSTSSVAPPPPSKAKVFLRRLISSVVLWTVVVTALFSSHKLVSDYVFLLIMVLLAASGLAEFYGLVEA